MAETTRKNQGGRGTDLPENFNDTLKSIASETMETALPKLHELLVQALGLQMPRGERIYKHGQFTQDCNEVEIKHMPIKRDRLPGFRNIQDPAQWKPKRGSMQDVRTDFTLIINGIKMPRAWLVNYVSVNTPAGQTQVESPLDLKFRAGLLSVDCNRNPTLLAICELHPLNPASLTNKIMTTKIGGIDIKLGGREHSVGVRLIDEHSRGDFQFMPVGGGDAEIIHARELDEANRVSSYLLTCKGDKLRDIARACNASVSAKAFKASEDDRRKLTIAAIMKVWEDKSRTQDRARIRAMCGDSYKGYVEIATEAIENGVIEAGKDYTLVEPDGTRYTLPGIWIPESFAGREAEHLASLMAEDDCLDEFVARLHDAMRVAVKRKPIVGDEITGLLDKLLAAERIVLLPNRAGYAEKDPDTGHEEPIGVTFHPNVALPKKRAMLEDWGRKVGADHLKALMVEDGLPIN